MEDKKLYMGNIIKYCFFDEFHDLIDPVTKSEISVMGEYKEVFLRNVLLLEISEDKYICVDDFNQFTEFLDKFGLSRLFFSTKPTSNKCFYVDSDSLELVTDKNIGEVQARSIRKKRDN